MSEVPNPFAAPGGQRPDPASDPGYGPSAYGPSPYGLPGPGEVPAYGSPPPDPYGVPSYGPYGAPPYGVGTYPPPYGAYPVPQQEGTNGLAIASMIVGIVSVVLCMWYIPAVVGLVLGIVALNQIKSRGTEGQGMAIAGVATSAVSLVVGIVLLVVALTSDSTSYDRYGPYAQVTQQATSGDAVV